MKPQQVDETLSHTLLDSPNTQFHVSPASTAYFHDMGAHYAYYFIQTQVAAKAECKNITF